MCAMSFTREDKNLRTDFRDPGWIPVGWDAPEQFAGTKVEDSNGVIVGFGDEKPPAISADGKRVRCAAFGRRTGCGIVDIAGDFAGMGVDDRDPVDTRGRDTTDRLLATFGRRLWFSGSLHSIVQGHRWFPKRQIQCLDQGI
jgi:hypothetical protein